MKKFILVAHMRRTSISIGLLEPSLVTFLFSMTETH